MVLRFDSGVEAGQNRMEIGYRNYTRHRPVHRGGQMGSVESPFQIITIFINFQCHYR